MHTSAQTWIRQRNLTHDHERVGELPREVVIYLLVTLVHHPERLPPEILTYLATHQFAQCVTPTCH